MRGCSYCGVIWVGPCCPREHAMALRRDAKTRNMVLTKQRSGALLDTVDRARRSRVMRSVPSKNSKPELGVRRIAHRLGLRFRLHVKALPGSPDIVFPRYRIVVFVHGCFWHRHPGCKLTVLPKSHRVFWQDKFATNVARDIRNQDDLIKLGWIVKVIWECETKREGRVVNLLLWVARSRSG